MRLLAVAGALATSAETPAAQPAESSPAAAKQEMPAEPTWRFRRRDRPVKVVVLAGSVGAFRGRSYARSLGEACHAVEIKNLSKQGLGAWALKRRFREQVLGNRRINLAAKGQEHWLLFGGVLNSVAMPEGSNRHVRELFVAAHRRGMKIVALTPTPWGSEWDKRRWAGVAGLKYRKDTQKVVDFLMGRLTPAEALGPLARKRKHGPNAPWDPTELADVRIDLYDSPLRDRDATPRDPVAMREALQADRTWQRAHADLDPAERRRQLEADVALLSEIPRWYLRPELRSFDHIHLNAQGHGQVAAIACPSLPASWQCRCPPNGQ
jgi:hypothetical protein